MKIEDAAASIGKRLFAVGAGTAATKISSTL